MLQHLSTRIEKNSSICVFIKKTLAFFCHLTWKRSVWWSGRNSKATCSPSKLTETVMTPHQLYEWASAAIPNIHFEYSSMQDYERESVHQEERFVRSRTIPGTRKYHSFVPVSKDKVKASFYSNSVAYMEERVTMAQNDLQLESIVGFVTSKMDCKWWLACVIEVIQANSCDINVTSPTWPFCFIQVYSFSRCLHSTFKWYLDTCWSKDNNRLCLYSIQERGLISYWELQASLCWQFSYSCSFFCLIK